MTDSILNTMKQMIPAMPSGDAFDTELIIHINTILGVLKQIGVGSSDGFFITGENETWSDFFGDSTTIQMAKTYMYLRLRLLFDPPENSSVLASYKEQIAELEWRCNIEVETNW